MIDGQLVTVESNNAIVKSDTRANAIFELNYHDGENTVEVTGTTVAFEFLLAAVIMSTAVASVGHRGSWQSDCTLRVLVITQYFFV